MISIKKLFNLRFLITSLLVFFLSASLHAQEGEDAKNKRVATTSGGWISGGIYASHISVGQNGISTLLFASGDQIEYSSSFGFIQPILEEAEPNNSPVAVATTNAVFFDTEETLVLDGFDPDGDPIEFVITQAPALGELTAGAIDGKYSFKVSDDLTPATGYQDTVKFLVRETEGELLSSEEAIFAFNFNVQDEAHEISSLDVTNISATEKTLDITFSDQRINDNYTLDISYLDLSNRADVTQEEIINEIFPLSSFERNGDVLSISIDINTTDFPYLFETEQVVVEIKVITPSSAFQDDEVFVLTNSQNENGETNTGAVAMRYNRVPLSFETGEVVEVTTSDDGLFFSYASETQTPENTAVAVNIYAIEFGDFSLSNSSIEITTDPARGSITEPVLVKTSDAVAQWVVFYTPDGEDGYTETFGFSISSGERGESASSAAEIEVVAVNDPPSLSEIADIQINEDEASTLSVNYSDVDNELTLSASSSDADNVAVSVSNGELSIVPAADYSGNVNITVEIVEVGTDELYRKQETFEIEVLSVNDAPIVASIDNQSIDEDNVFVYTLEASDVDSNIPLFTYNVTAGEAGQASITVEGSTLTVNPEADFNGTINLSVTADDRLGTNTSVSETETFSLVVNPVNDAPVSSAQIPNQVILDALPAYVIDLGVYFEDVETADADLIYSNNGSGNLFTLAADKDQLTVTPIQGQSGSESVTFTVSDGELTAEQTVLFTVQSSSSDIAAGSIDNITLDEDFSDYSIDLSGVFVDNNDVDAVFSYSLVGLTNLDSNLDGNILSLSSSDNYNGSETIFLIGAANGGSSFTTFSVTVNPVNDAPTLGTLEDQSIQEDASLSNAYITFEDIDNELDELTFTVTSSNSELLVNDDISIIESSTGITIEASPLADAYGSTTLTVTISDGELEASTTFDVSVLSLNDSPVATNEEPTDATEDTEYVIDITSLFNDVDGDALTYTIENNPEWLSVATNELTGTPSNDDVGTNTFSLIADDGSGGSVRRDFSIEVSNTNDAPTLVSEIADISTAEDELLSLLINESQFEDVDGDDLTLSASFTNADWLSFDAVNNRLTGTPTNADVGTIEVTITATDGNGASVADDLTITVTNTNDTPTDLAITGVTVAENSSIGTVIGSFSTTDVDLGDSFTYTLVDGTGDDNNTNFEISNDQLVTASEIDFESTPTFSVRVQTSDVAGLTFSKSVEITVTNVNESPTALDLSATAIDENSGSGVFIADLSSTDQDANDTFSYELVSGEGDTDNESFSIENGQLKTASDFNYETKSSYSIRIKTKDAGGLSFEESATILINDVNEAPTDISLDVNTIAENQDAGSAIGTLSTTDEDNGDSFSYTLVNGNADNDSFSLDENTLLTGESFDFETKNSFSIEVTTTDSEGETFVKTLSIEITNVDEPSISDIDDITFDITDIAETATSSFVIENTGDVDIEVSNISAPEGFSVDQTSLTVALGESATINVTFAPSEAKVYSGEIVVSSTAGENRVNVVGEGTIITSIDDDVLDTAEVQLYPNPARNTVTIDLSLAPAIDKNLSIIDLNGQVMWGIQSVERKVYVDIGNYPVGTYLVRVATEKGVVVKKLMIIK